MQSPLRILRKSQGHTLSQVAAVIEIDPANLSRIERGQQIASLEVAEKLVDFYSGLINELQIFYPQRYPNFTTTESDSTAETVPEKKVIQ
ncbi:helix-turn-helix transcriptional regulator [Buttiauxella selenatireducens]|uniref:Helix-turn-helix transcriptional regulator n=1 Tax=Buttiauxella selenatireducens TaxID=3073902 RepID=A0ABY9S5Q5_9ENTR|nr:helix-turn-helix transcriptional regulator [Buttiauxella sp. R73]WMY72763.1 helix-turn-helix transcriptional regulator [Buttiauxella sp. R73]